MPLKTVANIGSLAAYTKLVKDDAKALSDSGAAFVSFSKFVFPDKTHSAVIFFGIIPTTCAAAVKAGGVGAKAAGSATITGGEIVLEVAGGQVDYVELSKALVKCGVARKLRIPLEALDGAIGAPGAPAPKAGVKPTNPAPAAKAPFIGRKVTPPTAASGTPAKAVAPAPSANPAATTPASKLASPKMPAQAQRAAVAPQGKTPAPTNPGPAAAPGVANPTRPTTVTPQKNQPAPAPAAKAKPTPPAKPLVQSPNKGPMSAEEKAFRGTLVGLKQRYDDILEINPASAGVKAAFTQMLTTAKGGNFAGALIEAKRLETEINQVRRAETGVQSKARFQKTRVKKQQKRAARLQETFGAVKKSYFTAGGADNLALGNKDAGPQFQAFLALQKNFETKRDAASLQELVVAGNAFVDRVEKLDAKDPAKAANAKYAAICAQAVKAARHYQLAMDYDALPKPPWDEKTEMRAAELYAGLLLEQGDADSEGPKTTTPNSKSGVNGAYWIEKNTWDEDNIQSVKKTFIFKPFDAEATVAGYPKGGSAAREMMGKAVSDQLQSQMGLEFQVPETTVATIDGTKVINEKRGVVGARGTQRTGSIQHFKKSRGELKDLMEKDPAILNAIPKDEVEKMAVLDFVQLNTDRHSGNFMVSDQDDGQGGSKPRLVPIDNGLCLPSIKGLRARRTMLGAPHAVLGKTGAAQQKMSPEMVAKIQAIDATEVVDGMKKSFAAIAEVQKPTAEASQITEDNFKLTTRSIQFLKKACTELTIEEMQDAYVSSLEEIFDTPAEKMDEGFAKAIQNVKDRRAALKDLETVDVLKLEDELSALGWAMDSATFMPWVRLNPVQVMKIYRNKTTNPAAVKKIAEMRAILKDHPEGQKSWGKGLGTDIYELEKLCTQHRNQKALAYGEKVATNEAGDRAAVFEEYGGERRIKALDPDGNAKTLEAKLNLLIAQPLKVLGGKTLVDKIAKSHPGTPLKTPFQQFQALKAWKEYQALGGDAAYSRLGGNGEIENVVIRLPDLKKLSEVNLV